jgi:hypothetical protein
MRLLNIESSASTSEATSTPPASTAATPSSCYATSCSAPPGSPPPRQSRHKTRATPNHRSPSVHGVNAYSTSAPRKGQANALTRTRPRPYALRMSRFRTKLKPPLLATFRLGVDSGATGSGLLREGEHPRRDFAVRERWSL